MSVKIVCDTSTLIRLKKGNVLHVLDMFEKVYLPRSVVDEYMVHGERADLERPCFEVAEAARMLPLGMGIGERETISLAQELGIPSIITDDRAAIKKAYSVLGILPITSFRLLTAAKEKGIISSVKDALDTMKANGNGIGIKAYNDAIEEAGEA